MAKFTITLKAARVNAKKKLKEAAEHLGISARTLQNYESGKTIPDYDVVLKMSEYYEIPVDRIFFGSQYALSEQEWE